MVDIMVHSNWQTGISKICFGLDEHLLTPLEMAAYVSARTYAALTQTQRGA